jgi:hypothetical protein
VKHASSDLEIFPGRVSDEVLSRLLFIHRADITCRGGPVQGELCVERGKVTIPHFVLLVARRTATNDQIHSDIVNPHLDVSRRDDLDLKTSVSSSALSIDYPTLNLSVNAVLRR